MSNSSDYKYYEFFEPSTFQVTTNSHEPDYQLNYIVYSQYIHLSRAIKEMIHIEQHIESK